MLSRSSLKSGKPLQRKTPMSSSSTKTLAASAGLLRVAAVQAKARARDPKPVKLPKPMKSGGMKGRAPTIAEERFMDAIALLGCIACKKDGRTNPAVSIHHIDGRTKPGAHFLTLPLCGPHHQQDDSDPWGRISLHGRKATFQARYGTEPELLAECVAMITNSEAAAGATGAASEHITPEQ